MIAQYVWLAPLLPLLAALIIAARILSGRGRGDECERPTARIALGAVGSALLLLLVLDIVAVRDGLPGRIQAGTWLRAGEIDIPVSFLLDGLALGGATLSTLIVWLTLRFSVNYLHREPGFHRFFLIMCIFAAGLLFITLSGNAVMAFAGWELAGVSSYLLIGYVYERPVATGNALRAFVTNRIGDAGFVLGISLALAWLGSVEWNVVTAPGRIDTLLAGLLVLGFVVAALAKSAQIPFSSWILGALEGPTPSSAVFYGSLLVHAGVFLVLRLEPLLIQAPAIMVLIAAIGLITVLFGYFGGLVQTDVKSALMFAVLMQTGLMFLACGLGFFTLAAWHLALHASWRAWQFLSAPSFLLNSPGPARPVPDWLRHRIGLYNAALARFWLIPVSIWLAERPAQEFARDVRNLDDRVISRLVGLPAESRVAAPSDQRRDDVVVARGFAGEALAFIAGHLYRFESKLLLQEREGPVRRLLARIGGLLLIVETLLERPRYLFLTLLITLAAIL
jgi:NADH:ubiquinone oxidoreductase subunit 5 (subunit L)/multisubunit Na+/H+ antiporter MnhA subunit